MFIFLNHICLILYLYALITKNPNLKYKQFPPIVYLCLLFTNVRRAVFNSKYSSQLFALSILSPRTLLYMNVVFL